MRLMFRESLRAILGVAGFISIVVAAPVHGQATYNVAPLGTLGGPASFASGINDAGQVIGAADTVNGPSGDQGQHAFLYSGGVMLDLQNLVTPGSPPDKYSYANGLNASGQVVGTTNTPGYTANNAFVYSGGVVQYLGTLGGTDSYGNSINASGQIAGSSTIIVGNSTQHAFLYSGGVMHDLGTLGGTYSTGDAINDSGQVAVYSTIAGNTAGHAALYSDGSLHDLGTLGGTNSVPNNSGMNNSGQIVGYSDTTDGASHGFLYSGGVMQDLGTLGGIDSDAEGINASGQVVGWADTTSGSQDGFLYTGGVMLDLNSLVSGSGWTITDAQGINDSGWIAATGFNPVLNGGNPEALLLTPIEVPEPSTVGILGLGVVVLLVRRKSPQRCQSGGRRIAGEPS